MIPPSIRSAKDLITAHEVIREGFLKQAMTKTQKASPYVAEARRLSAILQTVENVESLLHHKDIRLPLLAAAGFSDKAGR